MNRITKVVAITGCDSGLGWALAARSAREGLVTVAGMYRGTETEAARALKKLNVYPCELDVTNKESVDGFKTYVDGILKENPNYELYALINNAGVMTIGDYEWQTERIILNTINTNLLGPMRLVSSFLPDLRRNAMNSSIGPRIINVASHCGLQPLPRFSSYCASKAGLLAWTRALRCEHRISGLSVVAFVPGGFAGTSNIMSNQLAAGKEMLENMNEEQRKLHEKTLTTLSNYLCGNTLGQETRFDNMKDERITETFMKALTVKNPRALYKVESWRYFVYYNLLKLPLPEPVLDWLMKRFLSFPV